MILSSKLCRFKMPAEWHPHAATWCCFPFNDNIWHGKLSEIRKEYVDFVKLIAKFEPVHLFVNSADESAEYAKEHFKDISNIHLHKVVMDDVWYRDNGPIFVQTQEKNLVALKWRFNAWGQKYPYSHDNEVAYQTFRILNCDYVNVDMVFEGGGIEVNGAGLALTTRQCLLNKNRNPNFTQQHIEDNLKTYLGIEHCIWLNHGLENDHTDGHIDTIARFANENTVICVYSEDIQDKDFATMQENLEILEQASQKHHFKIIRLPIPKEKIFLDGCALPCTYANFYLSDKFVIMPTYDDPNDDSALNILKSVFPHHEVFGLSSKHIISGGGSFHCLTQQQPQGHLS